jgi:HNH endonuclease
MYSYNRIITCLQCGKDSEQNKFSNRGKYCSQSCQNRYQYEQYVKSWLAGEVTGTSGQKGISRHVRRYVFEKYSSKCCQCGWCTPHPLDGRIPLEVDHIDGDWKNTKPDNLRLLCPNCHSLTETYKSRNKNSSREYKPK